MPNFARSFVSPVDLATERNYARRKIAVLEPIGKNEGVPIMAISLEGVSNQELVGRLKQFVAKGFLPPVECQELLGSNVVCGG